MKWLREAWSRFVAWVESVVFPIGGHRVSMHGPNGEFRGGTRGDLWPVVTRAPCWVVDNNVPWEEVSRREPDHTFILGRTMALESDSLRGAIRRIGRRPLPNVFTLEAQEVRGERVLVFDQVGATLKRKFGRPIPTVESRSAAALEEVNSTSIRDAKRQMVRQFELRDPGALQAELLRLKSSAYRDYVLAGEISLAVYSLHLRELRRGPAQDRVRKFEANHPSLFGDAEVIQEALFLNAGVFSNDAHDVIRMAGMLGIRTRSR